MMNWKTILSSIASLPGSKKWAVTVAGMLALTQVSDVTQQVAIAALAAVYVIGQSIVDAFAEKDEA